MEFCSNFKGEIGERVQGCSGQSVIFDFEITVTHTMISLGFLALKWATVTDI